ncbi:ABC transporter permease [Actinomadura sp. WMMB 499]|nr:ABC transporter permease [Actinomadura sp. WMMB 499]
MDTSRETRAAEQRPRPFPLVRHSLVLAGRSLIKTRRNPGLLSDALILPIIFLLLFVYLFGGAVAGSTQEYLQFIFPGVLVMTMVLAGMVSVGIAINVDIKKGVFDRFRSLPIGRSAPLLGLVISDIPRYVIAGAVLFATGYLMGFRVETNLLAALAALGLATLLGFALSWITILIGVAIKEETVVTTVGFVAIFPLSFGTSMAVPEDTMPGWLQAWVGVNPVSHAVDACRGLLVGGPVAGDVIATLLWSAGFLAVFAPLAVRVYRRRS